jgi:hypothetical protein
MAAPSYTEDLTDIDLAESGSTGWTAFNISGGGGGTPAFGADFGMQGGGCWDKAASNAERAAAVNKTPGTGTVAAGVHIFQWGFNATPGVCDTLQNRGAYVLIGTSTANFMQFHVEGSDTYGAQGRVGKCYVVDYHTTANTGSVPYSTSNGSPGATPTYFGFGLKTLATVKGSNFGVDAVRYGTGAYLTAGELISAGDGSDDPCTFVGFNAQNDNNSNRWGILTSIGGTNYELQGTFAIGQNNAGTATLCRFSDSNRNISLVDTVHSSSDFTKIIIDHASTRCEWTNINITALGTINPGEFTVNTTSTVIIKGGIFTNIGVSTLNTGCDFHGMTWRGCDEVVGAGASLNNCNIFEPNISANTSSLVWNVNTDPDGLLDGTTFTKTSGVAHHAIEFGTAIADGADFTLNDCNFGTDFSATEGGTTGDETFHFLDTTGSITLNLVGCTGNFGYRTEGVSVNIVADPVTTTVSVTDHLGSPYLGARVILETSSGTGPLPYYDTVTITRSGTTATATHTAHGVPTGKKVVIRGADDDLYNGVFTITSTGVNSYTYTMNGTPTASPAVPEGTSTVINAQTQTSYDNSPTTEGTFTQGTGYSTLDVITLDNNITALVVSVGTSNVLGFTLGTTGQTGSVPAGTTLNQVSVSPTGGTGFSVTVDIDNVDGPVIASSGVILEGLTDSGGEISDSRTLSSAQPVTGVIRKATSSPIYKDFPLNATISSTLGASLSAMLTLDE